MSYRNPQIVQPAKVGEIYGAGIAQFGKNISKGIDAYALKQEKILKEQQAELKKQQDLYNKVDFEKAQMTANFQQKTKKYQLSDQLRPIADKAIKNFGDAKIALLTETDPAKRAEYNKMLQNSYSTLIDAEAFVGALQADSQDYLSIQNAGEIGITKGIAATGADASPSAGTGTCAPSTTVAAGAGASPSAGTGAGSPSAAAASGAGTSPSVVAFSADGDSELLVLELFPNNLCKNPGWFSSLLLLDS